MPVAGFLISKLDVELVTNNLLSTLPTPWVSDATAPRWPWPPLACWGWQRAASSRATRAWRCYSLSTMCLGARSTSSRSEATVEGCEWLSRVVRSSTGGLPSCGQPELCVSSVRVGSEVESRWWLLRDCTESLVCSCANSGIRTLRQWTPHSNLYSTTSDSAQRTLLALVVETPDGRRVDHYEGEIDAERLVRTLGFESDGGVAYYEGDRGAERRVRIEYPDGAVSHFEGEMDAERLVRCELPDGSVDHHEGEVAGAERFSCCKFPCGMADHYEGERGAERLVRCELPGGGAQHFEGDRGGERWVSCELPGGEVGHFEGEVDAERLVRSEEHNGTVHYFEGEEGASCSDAVRERAQMAFTTAARITESEATWGAMTTTNAATQASAQKLAPTTRFGGTGKEKMY